MQLTWSLNPGTCWPWLLVGISIGAAISIIVLEITRRVHARRKLLRDEWNQVHFARTAKLKRMEEKVVMEDGEVLQGFIYRSSVSPGGDEADAGVPGPAVLFLHGFGGFAQDVHFEPMLSSLALGGYTVFAYDYRWSGHSRKKGQGGPFEGVMKEGTRFFKHLFDDARTAIDWVLSHEDLVDPERLAVIGFSMGGTIALSDPVFKHPAVKVIIAGCTLHDLGENVRKQIFQGSFFMKFLGWYLAWKIRRGAKENIDEFLEVLSRLSPASTSIGGEGPADAAPGDESGKKIFLTHCKDDSVVDFELNFVKNKEKFHVPDDRCLVFESGDHVFEHDENPLGAWILYQLARNL